MDEKLQKLCDEFVAGKNAFKKKYWSESSVQAAATSMIMVTHGKTFDPEKFDDAYKVLKKNFGVFSNFRDNMRVFSAANISLADNMDKKAIDVKEVYDCLTKKFSQFLHGQYLPMASFCIVENSESKDYESIAARCREVYDIISKNHPVLTSSSDIPLIALIALSGLSDEEINERTEKSYNLLKEKMRWNKEGVQQLSFIQTVLGGDTEAMCDKVIKIKECMKKNKTTFGYSYEAPILAILATVDMDPEEIAQNVSEVDAYLKKQKKMNFFYIDTQQRRMFASVLFAMTQISGDDAKMAAVAATTSTLTQIIIEELILLSIIISTSVTSSTASSTN